MSLFADFFLVLALGFFFGLAFEDFYSRRGGKERPGGVRTFPLLALAGALLYRADAGNLLPFSVGLLILGAWLTAYYWSQVAEAGSEGHSNAGLMVPICNVLAYLLGPAVLIGPPWVAIAVTVGAVLLLAARERLHELARRIELAEIVTAGKFLILTGLIMPILPDEPVTSLTQITPHQLWLAVLAVCTVSYASYLLQRYVAPQGAGWWVALLGGLYSSTATTVVLAKRAGADPEALRMAQTGIVLATAVMYLRLLFIIALLNWSLAVELAAPLLVLAAAGTALAAFRGNPASVGKTQIGSATPANPLELNAALLFAVMFVVISVASNWVNAHFGAGGIYGLAAVVGFSDIDPFVLSVAQERGGTVSVGIGAAAVLIAASSNNLLKAAYTVSLMRSGGSFAPAVALSLLGVLGLGAAAWTTGLL
ncbi:MAG: MgtC/SapB family protein [Ignavibacteria bacterium]